MKLNDKSAFAYLSVLSFLILSFPLLIRFFSFNLILPGKDPYFYLLYDSKTPYHFIISFFPFASYVLPFVLSFVSIILFYSFLRTLDVNLKHALLSSLLLLISPAFLYLSIISSPYSLFFFILLLSLRMIVSDKNYSQILSFVFFASLSLFGFYESIIGIVFMFLSSFLLRKHKIIAIICSVVMLSVSSIYSSPLSFNFAVNSLPSVLTNSFSDLGANVGFGIFNILLGVIGLLFSWKFKSRIYPVYVSMLFFVLMSVFIDYSYFIFVNLILVIFCAHAFIKIIGMRYEIDLIKTFTLLAVICGFLFSGVSYSDRMSFLPPNQEIVDGLEWLNGHSENKDVILSHYSYGYWISYFADRSSFSNDLDKKNLLSSDIYYGRNIDKASEIFNQNNIRYVLITKEMKEGLVWGRSDEGLLFLLHNSEKFSKVYSSDNVEIWEYSG